MGFYMVWGSFGVILGSFLSPMRWLTRPGRPSETMHNERLLLIGWLDGWTVGRAAAQNHQKSALAHQVFALRFFWRFQALFWRTWFAEKNHSFGRQTKKKKSYGPSGRFSFQDFRHLEKFRVFAKNHPKSSWGASQRLRPVRFNPPTAGEVWG